MEGARKVRKINNTWYIMKLDESLGRIAQWLVINKG